MTKLSKIVLIGVLVGLWATIGLLHYKVKVLEERLEISEIVGINNFRIGASNMTNAREMLTLMAVMHSLDVKGNAKVQKVRKELEKIKKIK